MLIAVGGGGFCIGRLINVGQMLIGVGGSVPFGGVSLVAATWFPPGQRASATAIASVFSYVGVAASFIVGEPSQVACFVTFVVPNFLLFSSDLSCI